MWWQTFLKLSDLTNKIDLIIFEYYNHWIITIEIVSLFNLQIRHMYYHYGMKTHNAHTEAICMRTVSHNSNNTSSSTRRVAQNVTQWWSNFAAGCDSVCRLIQHCGKGGSSGPGQRLWVHPVLKHIHLLICIKFIFSWLVLHFIPFVSCQSNKIKYGRTYTPVVPLCV